MFGQAATHWITRALFLLVTIVASAWAGAESFTLASVVTVLFGVAGFIAIEVKVSMKDEKWPPDFLELDYVRHVAAHHIKVDAIESAFRAATTVEDLSTRLRSAAPNTISCPWFDEELMATKYIAHINLARDALGLPIFIEPRWQQALI